MKDNRIDLHIHSNISKDAQYPPRRLMELCRQNGLKIISISDHNSIRGIFAAKEAIKDLKMDLIIIPAIELDCHFNGVELHILGYGIDPKEPWFTDYDNYINDEDRRVSEIRADKIRVLGIHLDPKALEHVSIDGILTGDMIAKVALSDARNADNTLLKPYREGGSRDDNPLINFYWDFLAQGKQAYVEVQFITAAEAVKRIKDAGGIAIFAHPGNNIGMDDDLLEEILQLDIDGIEVYSSYHTEEKTRYYRQKTLDHGILMTLGSDYHGKTKPAIKLGKFVCPDEEQITQRFMNRPEIKRYL